MISHRRALAVAAVAAILCVTAVVGRGSSQEQNDGELGAFARTSLGRFPVLRYPIVPPSFLRHPGPSQPGDTKTWVCTAAGGGDWSSSDCWSPAGEPTASDDVDLSTAGNWTCTITVSERARCAAALCAAGLCVAVLCLQKKRE